jgi:hypothetical protein
MKERSVGRGEVKFCSSLVSWIALGAWPLASISAEEPRRAVAVRTIDEPGLSGRLIRFHLSDGLRLRAANGQEQFVPADRVVRLTALAPTRSSQPVETVFTLANGDRLAGRLLPSTDDSLNVDTRDLGPLKLPLDAVQEIATVRADMPAHQSTVAWFLRTSPARDDRVLLTNGDVLRGFVQGLDAQHLYLENEAGESEVAWRVVVAVRLASVASGPTARLLAAVTFTSGDRYTFTDLRWDGDRAVGEWNQTQRVDFETEPIARVDIVGGLCEWLSEHEPLSFVHTPLLSLDWPVLKNRNVLGHPPSVAGEVFERALGVHSRSTLLYELKGAYREFQTSYGLDDQSGRLADVTVRIRVDDRTRHEEPNVRRGKLYGPVRLDVSRANRIELIVDFGENGDLQDRFNWIEPALIRE